MLSHNTGPIFLAWKMGISRRAQIQSNKTSELLSLYFCLMNSELNFCTGSDLGEISYLRLILISSTFPLSLGFFGLYPLVLFSMGFADFNSAALLSWNQRQKSRSCQVAEASDKDFILHAGCDFCLLSTDVFTCVIPSWQGSRLLRTGKSAANKTFYKGLNFF